MKKIGRRGLQYIKWRDEVAKPYLDKKYGHVCSVEGCDKTTGLEVDHIVKRSGLGAPLKMVLSNVQYMCWWHHRQKHP